jgi:hypothetical protein
MCLAWRGNVGSSTTLHPRPGDNELGVNRVTLSRVLDGKAGIGVDFVLRPEAWLDEPNAESWLKGLTGGQDGLATIPCFRLTAGRDRLYLCRSN